MPEYSFFFFAKCILFQHRDDIVETLFLNMFNAGRLKAMPPKLLADDKRNIIIRPLAYCVEDDLIRFAEHKKFPIIPCNLCGSQENLQRQSIKAMLKEWDISYPGRVDTIFASLKRVSLSQLADTELFDFSNLEVDRSTPRALTTMGKPVEDGGPLAQEDSSLIQAINVG